MSTRCQVKVTNGEEEITLYHHTDGYESNMIPLIQKAWETYGQGWEGARVYKVASMLCATDPVIFEPLPYKELHGDIQYYYVVNCKGESHMGAKPVWTIEAYEVEFNFNGEKSDQERLKLIKTYQINKEYKF